MIRFSFLYRRNGRIYKDIIEADSWEEAEYYASLVNGYDVCKELFEIDL